MNGSTQIVDRMGRYGKARGHIVDGGPFLVPYLPCRKKLLTAYDGNPITYDAIGNPTT